MPVGAPTNIIDAAPVPVRLDVDTAISKIVQTEELEKQATENIIPNPDENTDSFNAMFVNTVNTGVCGSYTTPYTEYYEL